MAKLPQVAAIHDLSGFGRCSLNIALPVLSAMGVRCCPVPTAILSNHTEFSVGYFFHDLTAILDDYLAYWQKLNLQFNAIYSGFLGSEQQIEFVLKFANTFSSTLIVDPVMGDLGQIYTTFGPDFCNKMRKLIAQADIITPNLTEAYVLTEHQYNGESLNESEALSLAKNLAEIGPKKVVLTGIHRDDEHILNLAFDKSQNSHYIEAVTRVPQQYNGTGDAFTTVLTGALVLGQSLPAALKKATEFLYKATKFSYDNHVDPIDGVALEPLLKEI
ncbi:MAG: pyridoxamine kinase [Clostridia bacterium]|nr:pyridoxamine kinase [Clostridia bacterium]MDD4799011.1 pyridoxamine kinase [Clostridia bacterium]